MRLLKSDSILNRFIMGVAMVITVIMVTFSLVIIFHNSRAMEKDLHTQITKLISFSQKSLGIALWQYNYDYIRDYIESLFLYEDLVFASVINKETEIRKVINSQFKEFSYEKFSVSPNFIVAEATVLHDKNDVGRVQLVLTRKRVTNLVRVSSTVAITLLLIVNVAAFGTIFLLSKRYIFRPLSQLEATVSMIAGGNLNASIDVSSKDEIGQLAESFRQMMENLNKITASRDELNAERKLLQKTKEALQISEKELVLKNKELEQIVYVTSHDLRSPLVNIQGFSAEIERDLENLAQICKTQKLPEEEKEKIAPLLLNDIPESLNFIKKSSVKMDTLLSGLLRLSRVGRVMTTIKLCDMNDLMTEVIATSEYQIKSVGALVEVDPLPPCRGDADLLSQVFSNIIDNALKYLAPDRPGQIRISGDVAEERAIYQIADNGIGIALHYQDKIFDIFQQLNPAISQGEGMGLSIIRRILDKHNGKVWLESEPGKGSTFFVELPA